MASHVPIIDPVSENIFFDIMLKATYWNNPPEIRKIVRGDDESQGEKELRDNLTKLWNSYYLLTSEEEEIIKKLSSRL
jgi:hypothetical protein